MDGPAVLSMPPLTPSQKTAQSPQPQSHPKQNQVTSEKSSEKTSEINGLRFLRIMCIRAIEKKIFKKSERKKCLGKFSFTHIELAMR